MDGVWRFRVTELLQFGESCLNRPARDAWRPYLLKTKGITSASLALLLLRRHDSGIPTWGSIALPSVSFRGPARFLSRAKSKVEVLLQILQVACQFTRVAGIPKD